MTRTEVRQLFPDTFAFFRDMSDAHPFWREMNQVHVRDAKRGGTLLDDLEQVFSSLHMIDGHRTLQGRLQKAETLEELMELLTRLYIAYLYRHHKSRLIHDQDHDFDIELEVADQLLALGVVQFKNFDSLTSQFADEIQSDLEYMHGLKNGQASDFVERLRERAGKLGEHPTAHHQALVAVTHHAHFPRQLRLVEHLKESRSEMERHFPHLSGVLLVDPTPNRERAVFVPFHEEGHELELLLNKRG